MSKSLLTSLINFFSKITGFVDKERVIICLFPRVLHVVLAPPEQDKTLISYKLH